MDKKSRQQALDDVSVDDLEKIKAHQAKTKSAYPVDQEWLLLAEFARTYGWQAYIDVKNDVITTPEMMTLIEANRKLEALDFYNHAQASFIASASSQGKKPADAFKRMTKNIIKNSKVDEE